MKTLYLVVVACLTGVGIALLILNYWSSTVCPEDNISAAEMEFFVKSLEHRLLWSERKIAASIAHTEKIMKYVQSRTLDLEQSEFQHLSNAVQDEAIRLALILQKYPTPPFPGFFVEQGGGYEPNLEPFEMDDKFRTKDLYWDDVEYGKKNGLDGNSVWAETYKGEGGAGESPLSDVEATKLCGEWKTNYTVVPGVSWGNLPYDLQQQWLHHSCDYHLTDFTPAIPRADAAVEPAKLMDDDLVGVLDKDDKEEENPFI